MDKLLEIKLNQFGQDILTYHDIVSLFEESKWSEKKKFLEQLVFFIIQVKPNLNDIDEVIIQSKLKSTYTSCVMLKKGLNQSNLEKIINLPKNEIDKTIVLFIFLFKVPYKRRFLLEKNAEKPSLKWWYWDLSNEEVIAKVLELN